MTSRKNRKDKNATSEIARKYAMTPERIGKHEARVKETKAKYSMDAAKVDRALTEYLQIKDPIVVDGKAIMWCKRPSMKQLKAMIPNEMHPYVDKPEDVPEELREKYEDHFYEQMADIIAIPKKTAKEWEAINNPWLTRLFWNHIAEIANLLEGRIEGF